MKLFFGKLTTNAAISTVVTISCTTFSGAAFAQQIGQPEEGQQRRSTTDQLIAIENVSNEILKTEIQLLKHSATFHAAWLKPNRKKSWRQFAYKITDSTMTNAGMITIAASRYRYIDDPSKAPRSFLKAGHIVNLAAASILVGGTLTETVLDRIAEHRIARSKQDPKSALNEFLRLRTYLDKLISERNTLMSVNASLTQWQKDIIEADGLILQDMRELVSTEFYHAYREVAHLRGVRDAANATAIFSGATAGYVGSLNALLAVSNRNPSQTGVAGIGFITTGSTVAATPLIVKYAGSLAKKRASGKLDHHGIAKAISSPDQFDAHRARFEELVSTAPPSEASLLTAIDARNTIYKLHNEMLDARDLDRASLKERSKRDLAERLFFSSIVGGTNIARGAQLAVAGFHYGDAPQTTFKLVASAATAYIVGTGVWTADNIQSKVREELRERKIKRGKLSVHGKLLRDLEDLEQMEDQMSVY